MDITASHRTRATGRIEVRSYAPMPYDEPTDGPALARIHVEETFTGDISGEGVADFLQVLRGFTAALGQHAQIHLDYRFA